MPSRKVHSAWKNDKFTQRTPGLLALREPSNLSNLQECYILFWISVKKEFPDKNCVKNIELDNWPRGRILYFFYIFYIKISTFVHIRQPRPPPQIHAAHAHVTQ